ncbi:MAG: tRNA-dihydrouridine synthase family protein [Victivallaceae bacterium]|nr:tRNA-dihydrouridine synthase family protein [Victivallaceae bacterium]
MKPEGGGNNNFIFFKSGLRFPRFFPGPMEGVMTPLFCRVFHKLNLTSGWLTPYYRITTGIPKPAKLQKFLQPYMEAGLPVIAQLMGTDAALLAGAAGQMINCGARGINLNFACPSRQVIRSGAGGAMLRDIGLMTGILSEIKNALPDISLSVKIRCGFEDWRESEKIVPALTDAGIPDFIGVHFRTVKENYAVVPNGLERLRRVAVLAGTVPVIGSGDVFLCADAQKMLETGCAGAMIARGILQNPFLIHNLQKSEKRRITAEKGRQHFFKTLQETAKEQPDFFKRSKFLEYAAMIWGGNSPQFSEFTAFSDRELLDFKFFQNQPKLFPKS